MALTSAKNCAPREFYNLLERSRGKTGQGFVEDHEDVS